MLAVATGDVSEGRRRRSLPGPVTVSLPTTQTTPPPDWVDMDNCTTGGAITHHFNTSSMGSDSSIKLTMIREPVGMNLTILGRFGIQPTANDTDFWLDITDEIVLHNSTLNITLRSTPGGATVLARGSDVTTMSRNLTSLYIRVLCPSNDTTTDSNTTDEVGSSTRGRYSVSATVFEARYWDDVSETWQTSQDLEVGGCN